MRIFCLRIKPSLFLQHKDPTDWGQTPQLILKWMGNTWESDFASAAIDAKRQWSDIFEVLAWNVFQTIL